ncbi:uncharacterized protein LOC129912657 [Episyrphus balteatus]|uniref:uncharacterized protein LOC129912657 n=1 Tax=Episyrphus balteatus TaxID=286459 RepID=UPI0024857D4A|nr:uncharacterized protein LOC129912657 [Episyrphus balteatus]
MVYLIGIDFLKSNVFIPVSTFDSDFTKGFRQINNIIIVLKVPEEVKSYSTALLNLIESTPLIARVHLRSDSATLCFIGIDAEFVTEFLKTGLSIPILTFDADFKERLRQSINVVIVYQVPDEDYKRSKQQLTNFFKDLQVRKFVIISTNTLHSLTEYFSYFAEQKFTRIFGVVGNKSSYAYLPFAENPVREISDNADGDLIDAFKDLNGFAFRTLIFTDIPRTFWYRQKSGKDRIGGRNGQIFVEFLNRHNATFEEVLSNQTNEFFFDVIINATLNNYIDISMNAFFRQENLDISYPITIEESVIMVPSNGYLDPFDYFARPFQTAVWICILFTLIFITVSKIILNYLTTSRLNIWRSFSEVYLTLLSSSSGRSISSNYRLHFQILVLAFVLQRLYEVHFQSFLTAYIKIKQYDTIQDLVDNKIPVMISEFEWKRIKNDFYPRNFDKIAVPTDTLEYINQCISMENTSYSYVIDADRLQYLLNYQSLFGKNLFRRAREAINSYHVGFLMTFNSPFKEILNDFIIEKKNMDDVEHLEKPLTIHHLKFVWWFLAIGLIFSVLIFVIECAVYKLRKM